MPRNCQKQRNKAISAQTASPSSSTQQSHTCRNIYNTRPQYFENQIVKDKGGYIPCGAQSAIKTNYFLQTSVLEWTYELQPVVLYAFGQHKVNRLIFIVYANVEKGLCVQAYVYLHSAYGLHAYMYV